MEYNVLNTDSLSVITRAEIDSSISTAKAYPRSITEFIQKAISMVTINEDVAASCTYALPRKGKTIEGASVRLAEACCSAYGNIRAGARIVSNDGKTITAQGVCIDMENNYTATVEVKRRITDKEGNPYSEDMQVMTANAACSIAYRNAVYKVIPSALVNEIHQKAKEVARGTAETLVSRRGKALDYFHSLNVTDKQLCDLLGISKVNDIGLDELYTLTGLKNAIQSGEQTLHTLFEPEESEETKKKNSKNAASNYGLEKKGDNTNSPE